VQESDQLQQNHGKLELAYERMSRSMREKEESFEKEKKKTIEKVKRISSIFETATPEKTGTKRLREETDEEKAPGIETPPEKRLRSEISGSQSTGTVTDQLRPTQNVVPPQRPRQAVDIVPVGTIFRDKSSDQQIKSSPSPQVRGRRKVWMEKKDRERTKVGFAKWRKKKPSRASLTDWKNNIEVQLAVMTWKEACDVFPGLEETVT